VIFRKKKIEMEDSSLGALTWRRLKRNTPAMTGLFIIGLACAVAILGYLITSDKTPYANDQKPELHVMEPGFETQFLLVARDDETSAPGFFKKMLFGADQSFNAYTAFSYEFRGPNIVIEEFTGNHPNNGSKSGFNLADVAFALDHKFTPQYDSANQVIAFRRNGSEVMENISLAQLTALVKEKHIVKRKYLLGTDLLGRDLLSRLLIGTRISLTVGLISVLISIFIGIFLGSLAGYFGGAIDTIITWFMNVVWSIPTLLLVIAITLVLGKGIMQVFIAVGLTMWVDVARIVRGQILSIREKEFVEAGRALGFSHGRIIFRHILPNVMGPVIVMAASNFASAILMEAGLSFLGLGAQPPIPSWGEMINAHRGYILMDKAYLAFIPGAAIMLLVLSFMLLGNGLRDAMDTRLTDAKPAGSVV
jgi:peptide/nickel transport system permease protein